VVSISPVCGGPVRMPPDPNCLFRAYETTIAFSSSANTTYHASSNVDGKYSIKLPIGSYKIQAQGGQMYPSCPVENVVVQVNKTITKNIDCDSGMR
jgi:hypothetical protein